MTQKGFQSEIGFGGGGDADGYDIEGEFTSLSTQSGLSNTPKTMTFGAGGVTPNGHVSVDASGEGEVLTTGHYLIKKRARVGRSGASGISNVILWAEISTNGGVSWEILGNSVDVALDSSDQVITIFDVASLYLYAGVKLRYRFARDGDSDDSGDLIPSVPSAELQALGVPSTPSAQVTIYRHQSD